MHSFTLIIPISLIFGLLHYFIFPRKKTFERLVEITILLGLDIFICSFWLYVFEITPANGTTLLYPMWQSSIVIFVLCYISYNMKFRFFIYNRLHNYLPCNSKNIALGILPRPLLWLFYPIYAFEIRGMIPVYSRYGLPNGIVDLRSYSLSSIDRIVKEKLAGRISTIDIGSFNEWRLSDIPVNKKVILFKNV